MTTGADRTASGFRKVGDNTVLAARGAKVLADTIEKLGSKEGRTAGESKILAAALRQTGDAEDRVAARAVLADAAIRRLDDAMKDSSKDTGKASGEVSRLAKALDGLKAHGGPKLLGPALLLAPALASLGGVAAGAAAGIGGAFIAGGAALAAFGAIAKPVLTGARTAAAAVEKAQNNYNAAIAGGVKPAVAYKAEQIAIAKAYANLSPQQIALSRQLGAMAGAWQAVKAAQTPVVAGALQPWLRSVTDLTGKLGPIIAKVAPVIKGLGGQFDALVNSAAFRGFRDFVANTGSKVVGAVGGTLIDFVKAFMILLPKFNPLILKMTGGIAALGPAVLTWAGSKKTADDITRFMAWFNANGPAVGGLLKNIGGALKALAPGLTSGGALELKLISDFLGLVAKLPPSLAKPLAEVAGAALILNKMGGGKVISFLVTGKLGGIFGGGAAAGAGQGAAGGALGLWAKLFPGATVTAAGALGITVLIGVAAGAGLALWVNQFKKTEHPAPAAQQGPRAPFSADINAWKTYDGIINQTGRDADALRTKNLVPLLGETGKVSGGIQGLAGIMQGTLLTGLRAASAHSDTLRTRSLLPLRGEAGQVSGGIQGLAGIIRNNLTGAMNAGGAHADAFRTRNLGPLRGELAKDSGGVQGLQADISRLHGKTVSVGVHASGSGGMTFTEKVAQSISSGGFSLRSLAAGGMISQGTGPTADDVLIRASKGELIVPAHLVPQVKPVLGGKIPGFASGGIAGMLPWTSGAESGFAGAVAADLLRKEFAHLKATVHANAAAGPSSGGGHTGWNPGAGVNQWRLTTLKALGMLGLSPGLVLDVLYQMMTESGGNPFAVNRTDSNWIAGHPSVGLMQVIGGTYATYGAPKMGYPGPVAYGVSENPLANIYAALNYGKHGRGFGTGPGQIGSGHGYAKGGLVPGYAAGGLVGKQGAAYLKAWQTRHGGGFGAAWGPVPVNQQLTAMDAWQRQAATLAGAHGLTSAQHKHYAALAALDKRKAGVLTHERDEERAWRTILGGSDATLSSWIGAAGTQKSLQPAVKKWKAQRAGQEKTIGAISKMLGWPTAAQNKAAAAGTAGKTAAGAAAAAGPAITHTYGEVTDVIEAFLQAHAAPFARGGLVMDRGGYLKPGWNPPVYNGTGRPEQVIPAGRGGGSGRVVLEVTAGGTSAFEQFMLQALRKWVHVRGGGNVQTAFGR